MRCDEAKVRAAFNALAEQAKALALTEAERLRLVEAVLGDLVEESFDGVLEPVLCVAEGMVQAAGLALEPATQMLVDCGRQSAFRIMRPLEADEELPR